MFSKVALIALAAGAQVSFAAPLHQEERSLKAVGTALAGGAASLITGAVLNNKRSDSGVFVDTETGTIYMNTPDSNEGRSLKAVGTAIAGGIASGVAGAAVKSALDNRSLSAIENFFSNLKRDVPEARSLSAIENFFSNLKREEPEARSLSAIENFFSNLKRDENLDARSLSAIENFFSNLKRDEAIDARSLSAIKNFLGNLKREESGVMVDTETGTIYMDIPDSNEGRSLSAIENFFSNLKREEPEARSLSAIENFFSNLKRDTSSGLMVDTETGTLYMDVPDANEGRSLKAVGTAVAGGIASGVAGAVAKDIFNKRAVPSGLMVDTETGTLYMDVPDANEGRSLKAVGTAVAGGIASGVAGAVAKDIFNKRSEPSGVLVDTDSGVIFMDVPDANADRSLKAVGTAIAGGIASGVAGAAVKSALDNRSLSAIENFFSNLKRDEEARSLSAIENFFSNLKRDDDIDARSISAIKNFLGNLKRSELEESMAKRAINDLE